MVDNIYTQIYMDNQMTAVKGVLTNEIKMSNGYGIYPNIGTNTTLFINYFYFLFVLIYLRSFIDAAT